MSKKFNKNIQYTFNPQINLATSSVLTITGNSNTIGNIFTTGGNVGIGTTNPYYKLDVCGAININSTNGNQAGYITASNEASFNNKLIIQASRGVGGIGFNLVNEGRIMTIVGGTGNVGIRTTSPTSDLHVNGNYSNYQNSTTGYLLLSQGWGANAGFVSFHQADGTRKGYIGYGGTTEAFLLQGEGARQITIATNNVDRITITSGGNVGIGTTSPLYSLQVDGDVALNVMPGINSVGSIKIGRQDFNARWHMINCNNGTAASLNNMIFNLHDATTSTTVAPVLTLRGDGNVGIGTTSPSSNLEISGFAHSRLCIGSSASATIDLLRGGTNTFGVDGNVDWRISNSGGTLFIQTGLNSTITESMRIVSNNITIGNSLFVNGSLSKGSGTFDIPHPIDANKRLIHSFIEGPRCDLIYRGTVNLQNGTAQVNLDKDCVQENDCQMTSGTFESLCRHPVKYLHNNTSFNRIKGSISGNILTIICEDQHSNDSIDWMVIAERKDQIIYEWDKTNTNGYLQTEYTKYNN